MSVQQKPIYNDAFGASSPHTAIPVSKNCVTHPGVGDLLFHIHSVHFKPPLFAKEETSLQFYEHIVIANIITQLWCFPKKVETIIIPRFQIVGASFSLGPKRISLMFWLLLIASFCLIFFGSVAGGCKSESYYGVNSGACGSMVIGILLLLIPAPILLFLPCISKFHYVYLDTRSATSKAWFGSNVKENAFRFKKRGFDHKTDDSAIFDELYVLDYVYETFQKGGVDMMSEAHLLSHLNNVSLSTPMVPLHANKSVSDMVLSVAGITKHKKHNKQSGAEPSYPVQKRSIQV